MSIAAAQKLTPEAIVKQHIEQTFGSAAPEPRRRAEGTCRVSSLMGAGAVDGPFELISTSDSSRFNLRFGIPTYEGEAIAFDGKDVEVDFAQPRTNARSALGLFLSTYSVIIRDGLFGGVLNRRWPLRDLEARKAKLSYDGIKKLEDRELHRLRYRINRNQGDLTVHLYLEPDTFRHVATVYRATRGQDAAGLDVTSQQADQVSTLTETFSGFDPATPQGAPKEWTARYTRTGNRTIEWNYECKVASVEAGN